MAILVLLVIVYVSRAIQHSRRVGSHLMISHEIGTCAAESYNDRLSSTGVASVSQFHLDRSGAICVARRVRSRTEGLIS
jgi:hypothetical protein